jgi:hypothetical protein
MVEDRLTDGVRIGQLLASEIAGDRGRLDGIAVTDGDPDVEPTADGALAYRLVRVDEADRDDGDAPGHDDRDVDAPGRDDRDVDAPSRDDRDVVAEVYVHPDRTRVEFVRAPDAAADAAGEAGLRVRPKATRPPRTLVFVEDGAAVKRVRPVIEAVSAAIRGE